MGLNTAFAALLVRAREAGASFARVATIGRQSLTVPVEDLAAMARRLARPQPDWETFARDGYAEDFFTLFLGAERVTSFDNSDYQQPVVVHDFNLPVPASMHGSFDAVVDGGSLEHIFDVKQALANYIDMTNPGGRIFINTPANNLCGHGFYQFSPDLFYRAFDRSNGFEVEELTLIETPLKFVEASRQQQCYHTADPARLGQRVLLVNSRPVMIYVQARRTSDRPPFARPPQQSDHAFKWSSGAAPAEVEGDPRPPPPKTAKKRMREPNKGRFAYLPFWEVIRRRLQQRRKNSFRNRKWFEPFVP